METLSQATKNNSAAEEGGVKKKKPVKKRVFQFFTRMGALGEKVEVIPGEFEVDKIEIISNAIERGLKATKLG